MMQFIVKKDLLIFLQNKINLFNWMIFNNNE